MIVYNQEYYKALEKGFTCKDNGNKQIVGYFDAEWAGSPSSRHSISKYYVLVEGNLIIEK